MYRYSRHQAYAREQDKITTAMMMPCVLQCQANYFAVFCSSLSQNNCTSAIFLISGMALAILTGYGLKNGVTIPNRLAPTY